jgi:hypothetical protein
MPVGSTPFLLPGSPRTMGLHRALFRSLALGMALALSCPPASTAAQAVTVDEGEFRILVDGREVGRESFAIRRSGSGAEAQIIATAEIQMQVPEGRLDLRPALQASGQAMAVSAYQVKVSGYQQEEIYVTLGDRRFRTQIRTERGEQEREHRAAEGTLLLDAGVAHQYYFVSLRFPSEGGRVPVIVPREGRQYTLTVTVVGSTTVEIGGTALAARHLRLEGNGGAREIWVDEEGRVLRVRHPDAGYEAIRTAVP